jgi:hypothetical protein
LASAPFGVEARHAIVGTVRYEDQHQARRQGRFVEMDLLNPEVLARGDRL